jgi:hypothetical protein
MRPNAERPDACVMDTTTLLTAITTIALILTAATPIPGAFAELLKACIPVLTALRELRTALTSAPTPAEEDDPRGG